MWLNREVKKILITGCLGDIAISLSRILRKEGYTGEIIGADIRQEFYSSAFYDQSYILPKAEDKNYFSALEKLILTNEIQLFIPSTEQELAIVKALPEFMHTMNIKMLCIDKRILNICLDKLETARFFERNGIAFPKTILVGDKNSLQIPYIIKKRTGRGSKEFHIVNDELFRDYCEATRRGDIWQALLLPENEEYTCGVFKSTKSGTRTITIRRVMSGGLTLSGQVVNNPKIDQYLIEIADKLDLEGSVNVQLRLTAMGPIAFEINPRFSSTVVFRHLLGFKDFIWSLQALYNKKIDDYICDNYQKSFYRACKEYIF